MKRFIPIFLICFVSYGCGNYNPLSLVQVLATPSKSDSGETNGGPGAGAPPLPSGPPIPSPPPSPPSPHLQSITVTPASASVPKGASQTYFAQGAYSDGTTKEITSLVEWSIESPKPMVEFNFYRNTVVTTELGTGTIKAALDGVTGTSSLTVREAEPASLYAAPFSQRIGIGSIQDFAAYGSFTDQQNGHPTPISCHLSDPAVATVIETGDSHCRVQGLSAGTTTLILSSYGLSAEATIEVLPLESLGGYPAQFAPYMKVAVDESGAPIVVFRAPFQGVSELFWSRRGEDGRWSPQARIGARPDGGWGFFVMDPAPDGSILLVGTGLQGIYSVRYLPQQGWQGLETVTTNPLPFADSERALQVAYASGGIGVAAWSDGRYTYSNTYQAGSGWSAPAVQGSSISDFFTLTMNEAGKAILVWHQIAGDVTPPGYSYTAYASIYTAGSGWTAPSVLGEAKASAYPFSQINSSGEAIILWGETFPPYHEMMIHLFPDGSRTSPETFPEPNCGPEALDPQGNIFLLCGVDKSYRYLAGSGWQGPTNIDDVPFYPSQLKADRDGDVLMAGATGWKWFNHLSGWRPAGRIDTPRTRVVAFAFSMNSAGDAAVAMVSPFELWNPDTKVFDPYYELYLHSIPPE